MAIIVRRINPLASWKSISKTEFKCKKCGALVSFETVKPASDNSQEYLISGRYGQSQSENCGCSFKSSFSEYNMRPIQENPSQHTELVKQELCERCFKAAEITPVPESRQIAEKSVETPKKVSKKKSVKKVKKTKKVKKG